MASSYRSLLPLPSTTSFKSGHSRSRARLLIYALGLFSGSFLLYHAAFSSNDAPKASEDGFFNQNPQWRPDLRFRPMQGRPIKAEHVDSDGVESFPMADDGLPDDIPIHLPADNMPKYAYLSTPSSTGNPWPKKPWIAADFFSKDREVLDPPAPEWSDREAIEKNLARFDVKQITQESMTKFENLNVPTGRQPLTGTMGNKKKLRKVQAEPNESSEEREERNRRKQWVERAIRHGWEGYKKSAWGHDEVMPLTESHHDPFGGWGATIVDSLDLLLMLGWDREYALARAHVHSLDFKVQLGTPSQLRSGQLGLSTFETCIRYLGGFLAAYDQNGDELMVTRAKELADWLMGAFNTLKGLPVAKYALGLDLKGAQAGRLILAEVGSMSMEYTRLAQITGERKYFDLVQRVTDWMDKDLRKTIDHRGLIPIHIQDTMTTLRGSYSFGGQSDSYYEYLIKEYQLLAGGVDQYSRMYAEAVDTAIDHLVAEVEVIPGESLLTIGTSSWHTFEPDLEHLTCFAGAMLGLGAKLLNRPKDLEIGSRFTETCVWAYNATQSGVGPEQLTFYGNDDNDRYQKHFDTKGPYAVPRGSPVGVKRMDGAYKGRPETIESVFYMWRITGDKKWQEKGWSMFHAFVETTAVEGGFAAVAHVNKKPLVLRDSCESFLFAETLKYYWLLFSDNDVISLDDYVFNTEAHPFALSKVEPQPYQFPSDIAKVYLEKGDAEENIGTGTAVQLEHLLHRDLPGTRPGHLPGPDQPNDGRWHPSHFGGGAGAGMGGAGGAAGWLPP